MPGSLFASLDTTAYPLAKPVSFEDSSWPIRDPHQRRNLLMGDHADRGNSLLRPEATLKTGCSHSI